MGLSASWGLRQGWRQLSVMTVGFGLYMPLIAAAIATGIAFALGSSRGQAIHLFNPVIGRDIPIQCHDWNSDLYLSRLIINAAG